MIKKIYSSLLALLFCAGLAVAQDVNDQQYINQLYYRHNKIEINLTHRTIDISNASSSTDISTSSFNYSRNYSENYGNISTTSQAKQETKDITSWHIIKGGISELSDLDFLQLIGDQKLYDKIKSEDDARNRMRLIGNISIGTGVAAMLGGASLSAGEAVISGGALVTALGFFISSFNAPPHHYLSPDYALNKSDEYNIALKQKLNLPLNFE
jgi:hypothetical protein